jgi:hypothetical protein
MPVPSIPEELAIRGCSRLWRPHGIGASGRTFLISNPISFPRSTHSLSRQFFPHVRSLNYLQPGIRSNFELNGIFHSSDTFTSRPSPAGSDRVFLPK